MDIKARAENAKFRLAGKSTGLSKVRKSQHFMMSVRDIPSKALRLTLKIQGWNGNIISFSAIRRRLSPRSQKKSRRIFRNRDFIIKTMIAWWMNLTALQTFPGLQTEM